MFVMEIFNVIIMEDYCFWFKFGKMEDVKGNIGSVCIIKYKDGVDFVKRGCDKFVEVIVWKFFDEFGK